MSAKTANFEAMKKASQDLKDKIADLQSNLASLDEKKQTDALKVIEYLKEQDEMIDHSLKQLETESKKITGTKAEELERMFNDVDNAYRKALANYR